MGKKLLVSLTLAQVLLFGGENLIQNGGFESFDAESVNKWKYVHLEGWEGTAEVWSNKKGRVSRDGEYKIELDTKDSIVDQLSQVVTTEAGKHYLITLDAYARRSGTSDFEILVDGEVIARVTPTNRWYKYGGTFVGKGGEQTITLRELEDQNDGYGALIDTVVLQGGSSDIGRLLDEERAKYEILEPTGLDQIIEIIDNDRRIAYRVSPEEIEEAKEAAATMNELIKEAIRENGLANDGKLLASDVMEINLYLTKNYGSQWTDLREKFAKVEKHGEIYAIGHHAAKSVWGKIYNLGLPKYDDKHTAKLDGSKGDRFRYVAFLLDEVADKGSLKNSSYQEVKGTTGTGLDRIVEVILNDRGLNEKNPTSTLRAGARYADEMNKLIVEGIKATGIANDGSFSPADIRTLNHYLVDNYQSRWAELHGDDEDNEEYGYHLVQNDGATTRMFGHNVINTIADGIYHLGYPTDHKYHLVNEDGNRNQTFEDVAWWLEQGLAEDLKRGTLKNPSFKEVEGTTGTALDRIIDVIYHDEGLLRKVSMEDIRVAARNANRMNELIVEAIKELGVAEDRFISSEEVKAMNRYLVDHYQAEWAELHGDDEKDSETGFHRIQNDGAVDRIEGRNLINTVADGIYHLGYPTRFSSHLVNEDGNRNQSFYNVAYWLTRHLQADMQAGKLDK
ncbi:MAG: hypothetical protein GXO19_07670 [Epsilonproteobacteria bacterium]|nr:hypothetical protein [Campylobacterota bacterium]NPA57588.1 hypothetical protein [Campylobacterota bacterium]